MRRPPAATTGTTTTTLAAGVGEETKTATTRTVELPSLAAPRTDRRTGKSNQIKFIDYFVCASYKYYFKLIIYIYVAVTFTPHISKRFRGVYSVKNQFMLK